MQPVATYFGYLASLMLIIALLVSNNLKFRWFNTAGNLAFITYALFLQAIPVLITNCILLALNAWHLVKYRDYKVGRYIFEKEKQFLLEKGVKRILYIDVPNKNHLRFLRVMGFEAEQMNEGTVYVKMLS